MVRVNVIHSVSQKLVAATECYRQFEIQENQSINYAEWMGGVEVESEAEVGFLESNKIAV